MATDSTLTTEGEGGGREGGGERGREETSLHVCTADESSAVGAKGERAATDLNVEMGSAQQLEVESGQQLEEESGQQLQLEPVQGQASVAVEEGEEGEGGRWEGEGGEWEGEGEGGGQRGGEEREEGEGGGRTERGGEGEGEVESPNIEEEVSMGVEVNILMYSVISGISIFTAVSQERQPWEFAGKPLPLINLLPCPHLSPSVQLHKYWSQRYRLFSRYDDGICLDRGTTYHRISLLISWIAAHMHSSQINYYYS